MTMTASIAVSPYAQIGPRLVALGYGAVPVIPGSQMPGTYESGRWKGLQDWSKYSRELPDDFQVQSWASAPGGGVCVVCGGISRLVAIDLDSLDEAVNDAIKHVLPPTTVGKYGSKGETLFYRAAADVTFKSKHYKVKQEDNKFLPLVDVLFDGCQTVIPPTIHPKVKREYIWSRDHSLDMMEPEDLPELDDAAFARMIDVLKSVGWDETEDHKRVRAETVSSIVADTPHGALNALALSRLDSWVPGMASALYDLRTTSEGYDCIPAWRSDSTGKPLKERNRSLSIHPTGIRDFGIDKGYSPLDLVMVACDASLDVAFKYLNDCLGWSTTLPSGIAAAAETPTLVVPTVMSPEDFAEKQAQDWPETIEEDGTPGPRRKPDTALDDLLTYVPGWLGDMIDYISDTARAPSRVLALGAALTFGAMLTGRRIATPEHGATHLYLTNTAKTAVGKEHAPGCVKTVMRGIGTIHHLGPGKFGSAGGIVSLMSRTALSWTAIDEIGSFLKNVNAAKAPPHLADINLALRTIYGKNFESYETDEIKSQAFSSIQSPALNIYGVSTPKQLYEAIGAGDVENGFMNRWIVLDVPDRPAKRDPSSHYSTVPPKVLDGARKMYVGHDNALALSQRGSPDIAPDPYVVPWADAAAKQCFRDLEDEAIRLADADDHTGSLYGRVAENALRMATIRAVGIDPMDPVLTVEDMEWGKAVAMHSATAMVRDARELIGATETQKIGNEIMDMILAAPDYSVTKRDLYQRIGKKYPSRIFQDVLDNLIQHQERLSPPILVGLSTIYTLRKD